MSQNSPHLPSPPSDKDKENTDTMSQNSPHLPSPPPPPGYWQSPPPPPSGVQLQNEQQYTYYPQPYLPPKKDNTEKVNRGLAIAIFVSGIVAVLCSWIPGINFLMLIPALAAIGIGIYLLTAIKKSPENSKYRLFSGISIVLSSLAIVGFVISTVLMFSSALDSLSRPLSESNKDLTWEDDTATNWDDNNDYHDSASPATDPPEYYGDDDTGKEPDVEEPVSEEPVSEEPQQEAPESSNGYLDESVITVNNLDVYNNEGHFLQIEAAITNNSNTEIVALVAVLIKDEEIVGTGSAEINASPGETVDATFYSLDQLVEWDDVRFQIFY